MHLQYVHRLHSLALAPWLKHSHGCVGSFSCRATNAATGFEGRAPLPSGLTAVRKGCGLPALLLRGGLFLIEGARA